jgi:hypothetical protein
MNIGNGILRTIVSGKNSREAKIPGFWGFGIRCWFGQIAKTVPITYPTLLYSIVAVHRDTLGFAGFTRFSIFQSSSFTLFPRRSARHGFKDIDKSKTAFDDFQSMLQFLHISFRRRPRTKAIVIAMEYTHGLKKPGF